MYVLLTAHEGNAVRYMLEQRSPQGMYCVIRYSVKCHSMKCSSAKFPLVMWIR